MNMQHNLDSQEKLWYLKNTAHTLPKDGKNLQFF